MNSFKCILIVVFVSLVLLTACSSAEVPSGSSYLRKVENVFSRDEFLALDGGRSFEMFLYLGGKDQDIVDGSFVVTSGFQGPHYNSIEIAFVIPSLSVEEGDIVEMETYAIREKNVIYRVRQKRSEIGNCDFVTNSFLWNEAEDLYCIGIEGEGWRKISGTYGTWYKPPEEIKSQQESRTIK